MATARRPMNVVVLTGAGVSAESGIPTFRGADGLWEGHSLEAVATPEGFERDPDLVHRFYNARRRQLQSAEVQPNAAHRALAEFESRHQGEFLLVTQNIDDLHERAGSRQILHMHGELLKARWADTDEVFECRDDLSTATPHPLAAERVGRMRPHVVWFGEMPLGMERIAAAAAAADLFIAIGTSSVVYPAAGIVQWTPPTCRRVEINLEDTPTSPAFSERIRGPASAMVPDFFRSLG